MEFRYFADQKVTCWARTEFIISADTQEEADIKAKKMAINDSYFDDDDTMAEYSLLYETEELMTVEENKGHHTFELIRQSDNQTIYTNGNKQTSDNSQD